TIRSVPILPGYLGNPHPYLVQVPHSPGRSMARRPSRLGCGGYDESMKLFAEMNREQLREAALDALAVLPIGATEQHGPHLPTGTDYFAVETLAREAAATASNQIPVVVTPALPFGSSHHHFIFGAT